MKQGNKLQHSSYHVQQPCLSRQYPCHLSDSKSHSRIQNKEMPSKGAKSAKSWEPIEMTAFGMTAEDADLHLALCPWPMWIYTSGICLEQGTLLSCLVQRTIICCCCYAFWEITFVSNRFLFFWVIYWGLPNSREVILYFAFKDSSSQNTSKAIIFSKYMKKNAWIFLRLKVHLWI